jgi:lipopolysaccharide/colanic/teichoic acid biosynthesis glycosyltransferase
MSGPARAMTIDRHDVFASRPVNSQDWRFSLKYAIDRVVAVLTLLILIPVLLAIALAVRVSSRGPVFFRQRRVGLGGRVFDLYKFRTMVDQPTDPGFALANGVAPGGVEGTDRRTGIGRLLRATCLDELPQLVNVVRGDMSLIGPRPERPEFSRRFAAEIPGYADRHRVRCGITGWAQANGLRGQTSIADRVAYDNYYIDNWSLWLELRTLALTVIEVLRLRDGRTATSIRPAEVHGSTDANRQASIGPRRQPALGTAGAHWPVPRPDVILVAVERPASRTHCEQPARQRSVRFRATVCLTPRLRAGCPPSLVAAQGGAG